MKSKQEINDMLADIVLKANAIRVSGVKLDGDQWRLVWHIKEDLNDIVEQLTEE